MKDEINYYLKGEVLEKTEPKTNLKYCLNCKYVWEEWFLGTHNFKKHFDMPTYGLERKICNECKSKKIVEETNSY
tara:strand:+ start:739 stop:963 length:225 start_codon:yes stop_codon:yes gene_type:complete